MMTISVVIPAYNAERWIGRAIESVLNQTVRPAETIVVDDGSTDDTIGMVQEYKTAVRYVHQQNAGPGVARNRGISEAKSEWIAFLDADDEWLPHKIESQVRILERNRDIKWCSSAHEGITGKDALPYSLPKGLQLELQQRGSLPYFSALVKGITIGTPGFIIRRSVFNELGGFDPEMPAGQDTEMWCRIALYYRRIGYCSIPCWRYHSDNPDSVHRKWRGSRDLQLNRFCKNMRTAIELGPEVADEFRPYAKMKVMGFLMRMAARECFIRADTIRDAMCVFPLTLRERAFLKALRSLPKPVATRVVNRVQS